VDKKKTKPVNISNKKVLRIILLSLGCLFSGIGFVGLFVPLLPTTPFLLLSAACFVRSSEKLYSKLLGNKLLGVYIKSYLENRGIPLKVKLSAITLLWTGITLSAIFATESLVVRIILFIIAISVTIHIVKLKTENKLLED